MKNGGRKVMSAALAVVIASGLTACASSSPAADAQEPAADGTPVAATEMPENDGPLVPYAEPVTISWGVQARAVQHFHESDTYEDNRWSRKIKEDLNIDLEVAFSADTSTDAFRNKINTLLASGDLPDIMRWDDRNFFIQAYRAGYLADITDIFENYATDEVKEFRNKFPDSFEGASFDGRLYGFPTMNNNFHNGAFLWIRDDWLENTNSQPPKTVDEMVELARKFTFEDPDGNGADDTYGLGLIKNLVEPNYGTLTGLIDAFGIPGRRDYFYRGEDGKILFPYIQPEMKEVLALVRDMYAEGLIDPEFVVKDVSNTETDIASGKLGMMYHMNWGDWHPFNISYEADGVITRPYPIPTIEGKDFKIGIESNKKGNIFMLNAKCEHPEAFMKIINLYNETTLGTEDEQMFKDYWEFDQANLVPAFIETALPENYSQELFDALQAGSSEGLPVYLTQFYNYVVDFESGANVDSNAYGTWGQINTEGSMAISLNDYNGHLIPNVMAATLPETWLTNKSILETMYVTAFTSIIRGEQPLEYFDQFVTDWLNAGGQKVLDELEEIYPAE